MSDCVHEIQMIFAKVLMRDVVSPTTDLLETGLLDSMGMVELLFNLEQRFGFTPNFTELDFENFRSIEKIAEMIVTFDVSSTAQGVSA
jgi:D-alanine--poly(phosphoribitol) ligase subunit 2